MCWVKARAGVSLPWCCVTSSNCCGFPNPSHIAFPVFIRKKAQQDSVAEVFDSQQNAPGPAR